MGCRMRGPHGVFSVEVRDQGVGHAFDDDIHPVVPVNVEAASVKVSRPRSMLPIGTLRTTFRFDLVSRITIQMLSSFSRSRPSHRLPHGVLNRICESRRIGPSTPAR